MRKNDNKGSGLKASSALVFEACGRDWRIRRPADLESLWAAIDEEIFNEDERLPYWVEVWPASQALADWLWEQRDAINGRLCLDLGCGLGFTALAASLCGARVLAADYEREALSYARINAAVNAAPSPFWLAMDWRRPALMAGSLDYIWASDVLYEKRFAGPVLDFISHALAPRGKVWLTDPGRNTFTHFRSLLPRAGFSLKLARRLAVEPLYAHKAKVDVDIWEISA
ncbi:methyltransferase domain-containing protein [Desulfovibrio sp. OttesenSCG-928-G11]|nr:methyltransferase domain-containing protein [Desulfovibrio sp. OttesenSCG-928-G11]